MEEWKAQQYAFIVGESMKWRVSGEPYTYMTSLNTRYMSLQERTWLDELAKETGMVSFSGHIREGPVSGYRVIHFKEKTLEAYALRIEARRLREALADCQAELLQEKEYVKALMKDLGHG
jgi:hypothetical protein